MRATVARARARRPADRGSARTLRRSRSFTRYVRAPRGTMPPHTEKVAIGPRAGRHPRVSAGEAASASIDSVLPPKQARRPSVWLYFARPQQMALQPGTRLESYEVVAALGAGGMGEVYAPATASLNRDVALKILPERCLPATRIGWRASRARRRCWPLSITQTSRRSMEWSRAHRLQDGP